MNYSKGWEYSLEQNVFNHDLVGWFKVWLQPPPWGSGRTLEKINRRINRMRLFGDSEIKITRYQSRQMQGFAQSFYAKREIAKLEAILAKVKVGKASPAEKQSLHEYIVLIAANTHSGAKLERALLANPSWKGKAFGPLTTRALNAIKRQVDNATWDELSNSRISQLHPSLRSGVRRVINRVEDELGIQLRVTSGYRTFAEQNALYAIGRDNKGEIVDYEAIVTYAKGGESLHNYGLAFDVAEIQNGEVNYDLPWDSIAAIGKAEGFAWGGDWITLQDNPHFEKAFGLSLAELKDKRTQLASGSRYITILEGVSI